jgi:hypothetical protein
MKHAFRLFPAFCVLLLLPLLPLPIPPYLDFQVIYHADLGLLRGIPLYDHTGQVNLIAQLANVSPDQVYVLPFPYPPWYALALLPLALLPIQIAARVWFELNLLMLLVSVGLVTDGWQTPKRILVGLAAILFPPVLGTLFVGQYVIPVLLGAAVWIYAVRKQSPALTALGASLLTFKPHLGAIILMAGLFHLLFRRDSLGRRTMLCTFTAGALLFACGFFADHAWPIDYFHSLLAFSKDSGVASCGLCASFPVALVSLFSGQASLAPAPLIGSAIFIFLSTWLMVSRRGLIKDSTTVIVLAVFVTLLSSPYLLNYDFVLLLLPFLWLLEHSPTRLEGGLIVAAYLIPFFALGIWGRKGNIGFSISAMILLLLIYRGSRSLDVSPHAAYNPE